MSTITVDEGAAVLQAAKALAPELSERAREGEEQRTLPDDLIDKMHDIGLFRLALPASLGGLELDAMSIVPIIEEVARADGSSGWTAMIGNSTAFFAWLDPEVAKPLIESTPRFVSTGVFAPMGRAVPNGDGTFRVSGRWPFNSGCRHSSWLQCGVLVMDGDVPRMRAEGVPDWRFVFVRQEQAEILDTWDAAGLRGTGSDDLKLTDVVVPEERMVAPFFEPAHTDAPLYRMPFFRVAGVIFAGIPLGIARRALDEFTALAGSKVRGSASNTVAEDGHAQVELGRAEASLQAARSFVLDAIGQAWDLVVAGDEVPPPLAGRLALATQNAMRAAVEAVDVAYNLAGGGAVYSHHSLQRCFRDIHTVNQHVFFSADTYRRVAKLMLGLDQPVHLI